MVRAIPRKTRRTSQEVRRFSNWIFLLPTAFFLVGWQLYPIFRVAWMSFTNYKFLTPENARWVGFQNYVNAFSDPLLHQGLLRAAYFTAWFLPGCIFLPMVLAVMLDRVANPLLASLYRVVLLIPAVIPGSLIFVLWKWLYNFNIGPINLMLINLGLATPRTAPQWLGGTVLTIPAIAAFEIWWGLGYHTMFYLAGLAAIPKEMYEAARVDGANEWTLFWRITVPRLRPILLILVVLRFGTAMAVIDEYLILGGFNRFSPTYTWTIYMWDLAFKIGDWLQGYAATIGWIGAIAMLVVVAFLFWLFRSQD